MVAAWWRGVSGALLLAGVAGAPARPAGAQGDSVSVEALRAQWRVALPPGSPRAPVQPRVLPAMNASTPSAFGPEWGEGYVGAGYQHRTRPQPGSRTLGNEDGVVVAGVGFGRSRLVALEVEYASFSTFRSGFFNVGALSFKAFHRFDAGWVVAAGGERAVIVGREGTAAAPGSGRPRGCSCAVMVAARSGRWG
jgi:hypothetical protein